MEFSSERTLGRKLDVLILQVIRLILQEKLIHLFIEILHFLHGTSRRDLDQIEIILLDAVRLELETILLRDVRLDPLGLFQDPFDHTEALPVTIDRVLAAGGIHVDIPVIESLEDKFRLLGIDIEIRNEAEIIRYSVAESNVIFHDRRSLVECAVMKFFTPFIRIFRKALQMQKLLILVNIADLRDHSVRTGSLCRFGQDLQTIIVHPVIRVAKHDILASCVIQDALFIRHDTGILANHQTDCHVRIIFDDLIDHFYGIICRAIVAVEHFKIAERLLLDSAPFRR